MPTKRFRRTFSSGSRPTPDPYDIFLDREGFYRKHTARDSTSLFRVVSEQMYDVQDSHQQVRNDCVNFMIKHRAKYENEIEGNFDKYIQKMAKASTHGTVLELCALGHFLKRNIMIYEPFNLGVWLIKDPSYKKPFLRIFRTYEGHFDSVFVKAYMIKAAFCQSIVYETLYKNVFKLPDIEYTVEVMLHSGNELESGTVFARTQYDNDDHYANHIVFDDGRKFQLDRPENTLCILKNPKLCHFHNLDFEVAMKNLAKTTNNYHEYYSQFKSALDDKYTSCIRQLLNDGITPFPYKVAKALDPDMYRNVEFDSWSDARKELRIKYGWNLQVGSKCVVNLGTKESDTHNCYIQEVDEKTQMSIVYIDDLCEKRSVPNAWLRPPYVASSKQRCNRCVDSYEFGDFNEVDIDIDSCDFGKRRRGPKKFASKDQSESKLISCCDDSKLCDNDDAICKKDNLEQFTDLSNFQPNKSHNIVAYPIEFTSTAKNMTNNSNNAKNAKNRNANHTANKAIEQNQQVPLSKAEEDNDTQNAMIEPKINEGQMTIAQNPQQLAQHPQIVHHTQRHHVAEHVPVASYHPPVLNQPYGTHYFYNPPQYDVAEQSQQEVMVNQPVYTIPPSAYPVQPVHGYGATNPMIAYNYVPVQYGQWSSGYNSQGYVSSAPIPAQQIPYAAQQLPQALPLVRSDLLVSNGRINFNATYAFSPSGEDLPLNDKVTTRFFYNFGIEYWKLLTSVYGHNQLMAIIDGDLNPPEQNPSEIDSQHSDMASGMQQMNLDDNVTTPTPPRSGKGYNDNFNRRGSSMRYKRDTRPNMGQRFQGTFQGPTKSFQRNNSKYHSGGGVSAGDNGNNGGRNYDSTPVKETQHKPRYDHYNSQKREQYNVVPNNEIIIDHFNPNIPPFPYDRNGHPAYPNGPANVPRMTPPIAGARASSAVVQPYELANDVQYAGNQGRAFIALPGQPPFGAQHMNVHQHQGHHQMNANLWVAHPPGPNQLNTSNVSSAGSNPSN